MSKGFSGTPAPQFASQKRRKLTKRTADRALRKRIALEGYPIPPRPFTAEEVRDYLGGDSITCLRCGRSFQSMGKHLFLVHQLTAEEYRDMYGLPWMTGLSSKPSRERRGEATKRGQEESGYEPVPPTNAAPRPGRFQPFHRQRLEELACKMVGRPNPYGAEDFAKLVEQIVQGAKLADITGNGAPSTRWFFDWRAQHPEARKLFEERMDAAPFHLQCASGLSPGARFTQAIRDLREAGKGDTAIARELGVKMHQVRRRRQRAGIA